MDTMWSENIYICQAAEYIQYTSTYNQKHAKIKEHFIQAANTYFEAIKKQDDAYKIHTNGCILRIEGKRRIQKVVPPGFRGN